MVNKVINFQDKIQSINNKKNELEIKRKKALNKKTTFHFSDYELYVLIMELSDNLLSCNDFARDIMKNEEDDSSLEVYCYDALCTTRLIKRLYKKYLDGDCFTDSKMQFTLSDIEICMEALSITCDPFVNIEHHKGTYTFKDEYQELDRYYKTTFYLHTIFKNNRKLILENAESLRKQSLSRKELKKCEELEEYRKSLPISKRYKAEERLYNLYKKHYIEEYRSKIQFIHESVTYIGEHILWTTYFVKGNTKFNKFMAKYNYRLESQHFSYFDEYEIEEDKEMNPDMEYFPPGWRFSANVPKEEEYEKEIDESDDYEYYMEYEDFILSKVKDKIKNSEEMQDFKFEIIDCEEREEIYSYFNILNERLLDKFEEVIDDYCGINSIIYPDGKISYEFEKIMLLSYE